MTGRHWTALVTAAALALVGSACSIGDKEAMAERIRGAAEGVLAAGTFRGGISVGVTPVREKRPPRPGPPRILPIPALPFVDIRSDVGAALTLVADTTGSSVTVFEGSRLYQRRGTVPAPLAQVGSAAATNLVLLTPSGDTTVGDQPPTDAKKVAGRPWLRLDFDALPRTSQERSAGSLGIDPARLVRLLRGALPGSVRDLGEEAVSGTSTRRYGMNVSTEKAGRGRPNDERILVEKVLAANAVTGDTNKAEAWIDAAGRLRQVRATFRQSLDSTTRADLEVTIRLDEVGTPVDIALPAKRDIAAVGSLGQLLHAATGV